MRGITRSFLAGLLLQAFIHGSLAAQTPSNATPATRSLLANVVDSNGNPIRDLTKENFALFLNGKSSALASARYSYASRRVVVLLDVSGSMNGATSNAKWHIAEEAVRDLLEPAQPDVPIAMVTFASEVQATCNFAQGRTAIEKWLQENPDRPPKLKKKKTALFDGIGAALRLLGDPQAGDAIYAITDGGDNASDFSVHQVEEDLLRSGVRLFSLFFVGPVPRQEAADTFAGMVQDSGGQAFGIPGVEISGVSWDYAYDRVNRENVKVYTADLNTQINGFWTLELPGSTSFGKSKVKLLVRDATRKEVKNVIVTYPRVLLPAN